MNNDNEKKFNLGEFFYTVKKNLAVEAIILVLCIAAGILLAVMTPRYYVAKADVYIKPDYNSSTNLNETSVTQLTQNLVPTLKRLFTSENIVADANEKLKSDDMICSAGAIAVDDDGDKNVYIITVRYTDATENAARRKLMAVVAAFKEFVEETKTETGYVNVGVTSDGETIKKEVEVEEPVNFLIKIKADPLYGTVDENGNKVPSITVGSKKKTIVVLSVVLGVAAAFVYALCVYFVADKITSADRLEAVSQVKNLAVVTRKRNDKKDADPDALTELDLTKVSDSVIYDGICTKHKVYQIQSTVSGEGKSTVTANLAIDLGKSQRRTLIIDCDFAHPSIHRIFGLHRHVGITDYFKGDKTFDEIVKKTAYRNVDVLTCGNRIENHTIFFTSDKFREMIEEAKSRYDFVILDCAPVKLVSDYMSVSSLADATLMVVANAKVSSRDVARSVREINSSEGNVIGTIFNFVEAKRAGKSYYAYYADSKVKGEKE